MATWLEAPAGSCHTAAFRKINPNLFFFGGQGGLLGTEPFLDHIFLRLLLAVSSLRLCSSSLTHSLSLSTGAIQRWSSTTDCCNSLLSSFVFSSDLDYGFLDTVNHSS